MKKSVNNSKNNKGITLVSLVVTVIVLILLAGVSLNLTLGENGIITMARKAKENAELAQMEEEKMLNELYTQIEADGGLADGLDYDAILKLYEFKRAIADAIEEAGGVRPDNTEEAETFKESIKGIVTEVTKDATATDKDILVEKTAWVKGIKVTGSMINHGAVNQSLNAGESYTIPEGYHNGEGKVSVNNLTNQTDATAVAGEILTGKTAWVKGNKITGTMPNRGNLNWNPSSSTSYTVPAGYYSGGTISTANAYNAGVTNGRVGYYTKAQYDANYTNGYNAGYNNGVAATKTYTILKATCTNFSQTDLNETFTIPNNGTLIVTGAAFHYAAVTLTINGVAQSGTLVQDNIGDNRRVTLFIQSVKAGDTINVKSIHSNTGNERGANMVAALMN